MTGTSILTPLSMEYAVHAALMQDMFDLNAGKSLDMTLSDGPGRLMAETNRVFMKNAYLDVDTDTITTGSTADSYNPVLMLDRTIGQAPFSASRWFFHNLDLTLARQTFQWGKGDKLRGCAHAPNGHLIGAPEDEDVITYYNPRTNLVTNGPALSGSNQIADITLMPDGRHLLTPRTIGSFKIYEHVDSVEMPAQIDIALASPYFN